MWKLGKDRPWLGILAPILVLLLVFAVACRGSDEDATETSNGSGSSESTASSAGAGEGEALLEVVGPDGTASYTLDEIKAMQSTEGYGGMKSSTGRITPPGLTKGVLWKTFSRTWVASPRTWR